MSNFRGMRAIFCRRQQQDNRAGRSNFEPARHGTGNGFASGRRVYYLIHDLPRIAGPSWKVRPRTSAWYKLYVEATRGNVMLPDLPGKLRRMFPYGWVHKKRIWLDIVDRSMIFLLLLPPPMHSSRQTLCFIVVNLQQSLPSNQRQLPCAPIALKLCQVHNEHSHSRCTRETQRIRFYLDLSAWRFWQTGTARSITACGTTCWLHAHEVPNQRCHQVLMEYNEESGEQGAY